MKNIEWLKRGQTVTASRMEEAKAAKLPGAIMAVLWVGHTINNRDADKIEMAIKDNKTSKKKNATKGAK